MAPNAQKGHQEVQTQCCGQAEEIIAIPLSSLSPTWRSRIIAHLLTHSSAHIYGGPHMLSTVQGTGRYEPGPDPCPGKTQTLNTDSKEPSWTPVLNDLKFQKLKKGKVFRAPLFAEIPSSVDWREKGYVTSVKEQGSCCSCWAFGATGALEGQMFRKTSKLVSLSEQNLVDCSWPQGNKGCSGGLMDKAFQYVKENGGLDSEESYPYHARISGVPYHLSKIAANVTAFWSVVNKEDGLMTTVATVGPIAATVDASLNSFKFLKKGIYYDPKCTTKHPNHAVLVVGYGFKGEELDNKNYWIVKNSWGANWGKNGYILMAKDWDNHCGIATMARFPTI
uniref:Procathepsin L n=1 Tax=Suricata suricatta TaxID=37032 RepID=A0A673TJZ5_SURSU